VLIPVAIAGAGALAVALVLTPAWERVARRIGALAVPGPRDVHQTPTPTGGGVAMFAAFWLALGLAVWWTVSRGLWQPNTGLVWVALGATLILLVSAWDDLRPLPAGPRLAVQFLAACLAFHGGARIDVLTDPLGPGQYIYLQWWVSAPLTILWIVGMTNAVNWIDGLDGLAAGVTAIVGATLTAMALLTLGTAGSHLVVLAGAALVGSCLGFLRYNFQHRIFMGDAGAMFLGYVLAALSVLGGFKTATAIGFGIPVLAFSPILYDCGRTVWSRLRRRVAVHQADRSHWHHRLLDRGLSKQEAVVRIYLWTAVPCGAALVLFLLLR